MFRSTALRKGPGLAIVLALVCAARARRRAGAAGGQASQDAARTPTSCRRAPTSSSSAPRCSACTTRSAPATACRGCARTRSCAAPPSATRTTWSASASSTTPRRPASTMVDRIRGAGYAKRDRGWALGENLAWGTGGLATAARDPRAWMNSPGHRANILKRAYREVGIGIALGAPAGSPPRSPAPPTRRTSASAASGPVGGGLLASPPRGRRPAPPRAPLRPRRASAACSPSPPRPTT